jgi:hypothetical protein
MLTVWGRRNSFNLQKVMWLVGEWELPHTHIPAGGSYGGLDDPAFLAMNPHGRVPVIDDDPAIRNPRSTKSLHYPTRDEVAGGGRGFEPSVPPRLKQVRDRGMIAPQRRQVVAHRAAGDAAVVAAVEVRRQGHVRTAGFFPEPGLPRPIRFRSTTHRDPDLDPDLGGLAAGLLGQGAQLAEHVERAGRGLMPASSIVCHLPLNVTCGSAHSACMTSTCSSERRAARRLRPVVGPPATPAAIGSFRINPLNR